MTINQDHITWLSQDLDTKLNWADKTWEWEKHDSNLEQSDTVTLEFLGNQVINGASWSEAINASDETNHTHLANDWKQTRDLKATLAANTSLEENELNWVKQSETQGTASYVLKYLAAMRELTKQHTNEKRNLRTVAFIGVGGLILLNAAGFMATLTHFSLMGLILQLTASIVGAAGIGWVFGRGKKYLNARGQELTNVANIIAQDTIVHIEQMGSEKEIVEEIFHHYFKQDLKTTSTTTGWDMASPMVIMGVFAALQACQIIAIYFII